MSAQVASKRVEDFIASPDNCTKDKVPDLGQFLTLFLLSSIAWNGPQKAGSAVVRELFVRNALWITKADPDLAHCTKPIANRIERSWGPSSTVRALRRLGSRGHEAAQGGVGGAWRRGIRAVLPLTCVG